MPSAGEKSGKGIYKCKKCGKKIEIANDTDTLPPCPRCGGTDFIKI